MKNLCHFIQYNKICRRGKTQRRDDPPSVDSMLHSIHRRVNQATQRGWLNGVGQVESAGNNAGIKTLFTTAGKPHYELHVPRDNGSLFFVNFLRSWAGRQQNSVQFFSIQLLTIGRHRDCAAKDRAEFDRHSSHGIHNDPPRSFYTFPPSRILAPIVWRIGVNGHGEKYAAGKTIQRYSSLWKEINRSLLSRSTFKY